MIGNLLGNSATLELLHQPSAVHILSVTKTESKFQTETEKVPKTWKARDQIFTLMTTIINSNHIGMKQPNINSAHIACFYRTGFVSPFQKVDLLLVYHIITSDA